MNRNKFLLLVILLVSIVLAGLGGKYWYSIKTKNSEVQNGLSIKSKVGETTIEISSNNKDLNLESTSLNKLNVEDYLSRLSLTPLSSQPFIGIIDGQTLSANALRTVNITPKQVSFKIYSITDFKPGTSNSSLYEIDDKDKKPLYIVTYASFNPNTSLLTVPVYVNYETLTSLYPETERRNERLSSMIIFSLYLNFQQPPLTKNGDPFDHFLLKLQNKTQSLFLKNDEPLTLLESLGIIKVAHAQCSGADSCGTLTRPPGTCSSGGASCLIDSDCISGTCVRPAAYCSWANPAILSCMGNPPYGIGCTSPCAICPSNACTNSATPPPSGGGGGPIPTTPPAPPANGSCGSCNSCGDPDPNKCALINGVCSKAGYCGGGGGFTGCRIWDHAPVNMYVGETVNVTLSGFGYDGAVGPGGWVGAFSTPGIVAASSLAVNFGGSSFGDKVWNIQSTGLVAGATWLTGTWTMGDGENCTNSVLLNVLPNASAPTLVLTANGNQNAVSVPSGSNVTLAWVGTNVTNCVASNAWNGSKAATDSQVVNNITTNRTYTLTCDATAGGTISKSVDVNVGPNALPTINLTVNGSPSNYITTTPVNWATQFGVTNATFKWTTTGATSCVGTTLENSCSIYPYPSACPYSPVGGWFLWNQTLPTFSNGGSLSIINDPGALQHGTFTLSCTGVGGTTSRTVYVTTSAVPPSGPGQCATPTPNDPAAPVCALNPPSSLGSITWTWPAVPNADEYSIVIVDATTGATVTVVGMPAGFVNGQANFNCRPNRTPADTCSYKTNLPPGSYRSRIVARSSTNACTQSAVATYPAVGNPGMTVDLCPAVAWWQSGYGSLFSQGNIQSIIPPTCAAPTCINNLIQEDSSNHTPAFVIGGSSSSTQTGTGSISTKNWAAQSTLIGRKPDFDAFVNLIPVSITPSDPGATCGGATFNSGGATTGDGYYWYRHTGDVNITSDINLNPGRKVILYVDGNLTISGKISYNPGNSFFMAIVKQNTTVSPTVTTATGIPTLTGIFYSDGQFGSGLASTPLSVLGSVVANGGVSLQRDLGTQNHFEPAESFSISPDLLLNYPEALSFKRPVWKEVAP